MKHLGWLAVAAAAAGVWWHTRKKKPVMIPPPAAFAPITGSWTAPVAEKKETKVKKGASPKKGTTVELKVESDVEQMTQQVSIIGSCELPDGSAGLLIVDAYGEEQCVAGDT